MTATMYPPGRVVPADLFAYLRDTGLALPEGLPYEIWATFGPDLGRMVRASMWALGDWLLYGERHYGEMYAQAMELTGLAYSSLANAKWIASKFPIERRREGLDWSHHKEVAALPPDEQDLLLDLAAPTGPGMEAGLSVRDIREQVKIIRGHVPDDTYPEPPSPQAVRDTLESLLPPADADRATLVHDLQEVVRFAISTLSAYGHTPR
jgi:hypothetical protein